MLQFLLAGTDADLILLDLEMPGEQGLSGLVTQYPAIPVVVVSANNNVATMRQCLEVGASGYIPKSTPVQLVRVAVQCIPSGGQLLPDSDVPATDGNLETRLASLTPQQMRVLMLVRNGLLNKQIVFQLDVSEATVKAHVSAILEKFNVESRTQAVISINDVIFAQGKAGDVVRPVHG
jgi:DNA-binding NarL/FixJ family response regulator